MPIQGGIPKACRQQKPIFLVCGIRRSFGPGRTFYNLLQTLVRLVDRQTWIDLGQNNHIFQREQLYRSTRNPLRGANQDYWIWYFLNPVALFLLWQLLLLSMAR